MRKLFLISTLLFSLSTFQNLHAQNWLLAGNTAPVGSKLGTLNSQPLIIITKNGERLRIDTLGRVGIGTTTPAATALLTLASTSRGFLTPRMTTAQRNAIYLPAQGLLVYQTDGTHGFYYFDLGWHVVTPNVSGFANRALSNLTAPTAVNVDLLPNATNTRNLGSGTLNWNGLYLSGDVFKGSTRFLSNAGTNNTFLGLASGRTITTGANNAAIRKSIS